MEKNKYLFVKKNYNTKYLKFYTAKFETNGEPRDYYFVSRHDEEDLALLNKEIKPTAIDAFTYTGDKIIMIEEFRSPLNRKVFSFTAGLIEDGEDYKKAIKREVFEEIGGEVKNIELVQNYPMALCAGLTDEANIFAIVELSKIGKQHLETTEDIKVKTFTVDELEKKIQNSELELTVTGYLGCVLLINKIKANK